MTWNGAKLSLLLLSRLQAQNVILDFSTLLFRVSIFFSFIKSALLNRALCFVFRLICLLVIHTGRTYYSLNFVLFILFFICSCFCFLFAHMVWLASLLFIYRVLTSPLVTYSQGGLNCPLLPTLPAHLPTLALAALMHLQPISFL